MKKQLLLTISLLLLASQAKPDNNKTSTSVEAIVEGVETQVAAQSLYDEVEKDLQNTIKEIEEIDKMCAGKYDPTSKDFDPKCALRAGRFMYNQARLSALYAKRAWNSEILKKLRAQWPQIKASSKGFFGKYFNN